MKKIMFNDKYGLTQAVLEGRKTQTRRIITYPKTFKGKYVCGLYAYRWKVDGAITEICMYDENEIPIDEGRILPKYKVGEVVAVAQSYEKIWLENPSAFHNPYFLRGLPSWKNKMLVRASEMPHQIRIVNVRAERLQDIQEDDCLKEGIYPYYYGDEKEKRFYEIPPNGYTFDGTDFHYSEPREAFAHLINKVSRKDVWEENPYVFVYDFELVK